MIDSMVPVINSLKRGHRYECGARDLLMFLKALPGSVSIKGTYL
jgi:hypothetical protein